MDQSQYLIDSNIVIDYLSNRLPADGMYFMHSIIDAVPNVSVVTKIEVLSFNAPEEHYKTLSSFINDATILSLTNPVLEASIEIRKKHRTKLPDAIIAATAIANELMLLTRNVSDFKNIDGLQIIDPHNL